MSTVSGTSEEKATQTNEIYTGVEINKYNAKKREFVWIKIVTDDSSIWKDANVVKLIQSQLSESKTVLAELCKAQKVDKLICIQIASKTCTYSEFARLFKISKMEVASVGHFRNITMISVV
jgi:hypothetical protein